MDQCCSHCNKNILCIPGSSIRINPGNVVVLGRFSSIRWKVGFGWFSYDGNRKICGWYLTQVDDNTVIKPVQETDLYDIYILEA
jgi:hypothetical protein